MNKKKCSCYLMVLHKIGMIDLDVYPLPANSQERLNRLEKLPINELLNIMGNGINALRDNKTFNPCHEFNNKYEKRKKERLFINKI